MQVDIYGPNLNDQTLGSFHVHKAGCGHSRHYGGPGTKYGGGRAWTVEAASKLEVSGHIYSDHLSDFGYEDGTPEAIAYYRDNVDDFHFAPCCVRDLPDETTEEQAIPRPEHIAAETAVEPLLLPDDLSARAIAATGRMPYGAAIFGMVNLTPDARFGWDTARVDAERLVTWIEKLADAMTTIAADNQATEDELRILKLDVAAFRRVLGTAPEVQA